MYFFIPHRYYKVKRKRDVCITTYAKKRRLCHQLWNKLKLQLLLLYLLLITYYIVFFINGMIIIFKRCTEIMVYDERFKLQAQIVFIQPSTCDGSDVRQMSKKN